MGEAKTCVHLQVVKLKVKLRGMGQGVRAPQVDAPQVDARGVITRQACDARIEVDGGAVVCMCV